MMSQAQSSFTENISLRLVFSKQSLNYACDVISMFKISYTIALHGICVQYFIIFPSAIVSTFQLHITVGQSSLNTFLLRKVTFVLEMSWKSSGS